MSVPLVSVLIPTYKGAPYIKAAIDSVLAQTLRDFELIVIDDRSPDETAAIVQAIDDPRIVYLCNEKNLGPQGNWNRCLEAARGKYIKLLPHDDLLHPQCLERQVAALESDAEEGIALVFCAREVLNPEGRVLMRRGYPSRSSGRIAGEALIRNCVRRGTNLIGEPGAGLFRKSLADRVGPFDGSNPYVIDLDYWFRLLEHGDGWFDAQALASFRVSGQQWSVVIGRSQHRDFTEFVGRVAATRPRGLRPFDLFLSGVMSYVNNALRLLFYKIYIR